jgi:WD40 repeat protein/tRNA A-37 threonylcarbamoyl transferase component Bud32
VKELFLAARKLAEGERPAFLDTSCGGDAELRAEVESLLKHASDQDETASRLDFDGPSPFEDLDQPAKRIGRKVGRYTLRRIIGIGGMGTVYEAVQESPRRTVAVKVMKQGISSRSALRRFQYESQILGRLRHIGVAQIHEAGMHDDGTGGVPYFAMEYIPNARPITEYAREKKLGTRERLDLFAQVCDAVHHGHQKGIIHRDLKPSNILVDSSGQPKIIDFGVARSTDSDLAVTTLQTDVGQLIGTLQYMSPEQCDADPHDLDIRSDVYALGVVLYELLCDELPYDVSKAAIYEAAKVIREATPAKPSTLNRTLRGDVETITLKAMEKERERRYQSAADLGQDIHRYLHDEPIEARPPSVVYQVRRFARRNRGLFAALTITAMALILGIVGTTTGMIWGWSEAARATAEAQRADREAVEAQKNQRVAEEQRAEARQQAYFLSISGAERALERNEIVPMRRYLDESPVEYRNWEWHRLQAMSDSSLVVLQGHDSFVLSASFSPDGTRIVTASNDKTARVWDAATGEEVAVLREHDSVVFSASFSPDGTRIVTASDDRTARVWDAATGEEVAVLRGHDSVVSSASFSPDGTRIVTASWDKTARVWDAATGEEVVVLQWHGDIVHSASFSPDGTRIVAASHDQTARVWDATTGDRIAVLQGHDSFVLSASFSPDGTRIVTASYDRTARVWDAATGEEVAVLQGHDNFVVSSASFSPDGTRIVTASDDQTARVWDAATGEESAVLRGHDSVVSSASFSPDGTRIVTASDDRKARVWDAATGEEVAVLRGHDSVVSSASFSPDGTRIVTASNDETARVWDAATGEESAVLRGHDSVVSSASFSPDGTRIVTASYDETARVWDAATGEEVAVLRGHDSVVFSASFSPDGTRIVTASADRTARVWDAATGEEVAVLQRHDFRVNSASFSPDGTRIVTASDDRTARVWDAATGEESAVLRGHDSFVSSASFSSDGTRIVTASDDQTARVWDAATGEEVAVLQGHDRFVLGYVRSASFSPDGTRIVTASDDQTARVWDAATGAEVAVLRRHARGVFSASFSPDGTRIVTASEDQTARVWDATTGEEIAVLRGHDSFVSSASFSPDGTRIVTAFGDKTARVWDAATGEEVAVLQRHDFRVNSASFSPPDGTRIVTASNDQTACVWHSQPWRERQMEIDALRSAKSIMEPRVEAMLAQQTPLSDVAQRFRLDQSLTEIQKRAALNLLLRRSTDLRERAYALANGEVERHILTAAAADALQNASDLHERVRQMALQRINQLGDDPRRLNEAAWAIVREADEDSDRYLVAREAAAAASEAQPNEAMILNTLGVAQYRVGDYETAVQTLTRSDELNGGIPEDVAFLAMTHWQLGNEDEAKGQLARLRELMQSPEHASNEDGQLFLREAEALIEGTREEAPEPPGRDETSGAQPQ